MSEMDRRAKQAHRNHLPVGPPFSSTSGDSNIYEVMPSPVFLISPVSDVGPMNSAMVSPVHLELASPKALSPCLQVTGNHDSSLSGPLILSSILSFVHVGARGKGTSTMT